MVERKKTKFYFKTNEDAYNVDMDFIFKSIFKEHYVEIAKTIMLHASKKGSDGLFEEDWQEILKKYNLSEYKYFYVLRKLKTCGLIRKTNGRYYVSRELPTCFSRMSSAIHEYYNLLGVKQ